MSKTTSLVGALGAFGALAYLMAPLPPETPSADAAATASGPVAPSAPATASLPSPVSMPPQDSTVLLVQQLQTELLRLGCYNGAIDGQWTAAAQQAMHALGERVRVLRPVDTPDYIMLALARSQESRICEPRGEATAARQPARLVPMAAPWVTTTERPRAGSPPRRSADRAPGMAAEALPRARMSQSVESGAAEQAPAGQADADTVLLRERAGLEQNRMSLGAAAVDPLRAGIDPRDPTAPAVLRGPPPTAPRAAAGSGLAAPDTAQNADRIQRAPAETRPTPPSTRSRDRAWARTVFRKMEREGP